ncbi:hypothetical protein [Chitinophaga sp. Cy-1792]|uniref:Kelch repeat-containing protein n=1 Tax=Chitinophaga sp. Cy-1792 TaxID=2608339 RepID=UPI001421DA47|nr:hypothetical protein [Chitinophaga sp. Cy-1792]NIG57109.1 hypothetical protein [Chitinophaga sp. Cy-1792]
MKKNFIGIILLCCVICSCSKSSNTAPPSSVQSLQAVGTLQLPLPRYKPAAVFIGKKIYIVGDGFQTNAAPNIDIFDIPSATWSKIPSITNSYAFASATGNASLGIIAGSFITNTNTADGHILLIDNNNNTSTVAAAAVRRTAMGAATLDNISYFAGGSSAPDYAHASGEVDAYDQTSQTWASPHFLSTARIFPQVIGINKKVMIAGGTDFNGAQTYAIDILDAPSNSWSTAALSVKRAGFTIAAAANKIYLAGGVDPALNKMSDVIDVYDTQTAYWSVIHLPVARTGVCAATIGNLVVFAGGTATGAQYTDEVDYYNVVTNSWGSTKLSVARGFSCAVVANNKLYVIGGTSANGASNTIDVFSLN